MADEKTPTQLSPLPAPPQDAAVEALPDAALDAVAGGIGAPAITTTPAAPKKRGGATGVWSDASGHFD